MWRSQGGAARRRQFWPSATLCVGRHPLPPAAAHHLYHVLRLTVGAELELFDGAGRLGLAHLVAGGVDIKQVYAAPESGPALCVAVGCLDPERADWMVEKLVELGATDIHLLACARNDGRQVVTARRRLPRWERLVKAAAAQSRRTQLPTVAAGEDLSAFVARTATTQRCLVAHPAGAAAAACAAPLGGAARLVLVGPPGGLDPAELQNLAAAGYTPMRLGNHVLRSETAALAAAAALAESGEAAACPP